MQDSAEQLKIIPSNSLGSEGTKWKEFNLLPLEQQTKRREKQKSTTELFATKKKPVLQENYSDLKDFHTDWTNVWIYNV